MRAYLDAGFLLASIIHTTAGTSVANQLLRDIGGPCALNFLHQLQVENFLVSCQKRPGLPRQVAAAEGQRLWRNYLAEGVFQMTPTDWDSAFRVALTWNGQYPATPPPFLLLLHPALALVAGASHFLSFDPRSREIARRMGQELLPEKL